MIGRVLIANRGEIAVRIARTAADMGIEAVTVYADDDEASLHVQRADSAIGLGAPGPAAYLDAERIVAAAQEAGCDAVHPGYGFLSESALFAHACASAGLVFIGPAPDALALLGDKSAARAHAERCGVPILSGTEAPISLADARAFLDSLGAGAAVMVKAAAGGGGRGMRLVRSGKELEQAFDRCAAEARAAFGEDALYVERFLPGARHIEVQIVGDGSGAVSHLWDRECTLQRNRQKLVEFAPAEGLAPELRQRLLDDAVRIGAALSYRNLGTIEFLVAPQRDEYAFLEANPRLQVEHTVTEEIIRIDLVRTQFEIAGGATLGAVGLAQSEVPAAQGTALEVRINLETLASDGSVRPSGGTITTYEPPTGPAIRVDGCGYAGYRPSTRFDTLLAKLIVRIRSGGLEAAAAKARRALEEFRIAGPETNIGFLRALLGDKESIGDVRHTNVVEDRLPKILAALPSREAGSGTPATKDPLAVLDYGRAAESAEPKPPASAPKGQLAIRSPIVGSLVSVAVEAGEKVKAGTEIAVVEAMKMHHSVTTPAPGSITEILVGADDAVEEGQPLFFLLAEESAGGEEHIAKDTIDPDHVRADLAELLARKERTQDEARPEAVAKRRKSGQRTARENIEDLCDADSFVEYGSLVVAGRSRRNTMQELIDISPADGLVMGLATVNGDLVGLERARAAVMSYDYTVFAGTQGARNHIKTDRMAELAQRLRLPIVFFTEGGGGRPGDTDSGGFIRAFEYFGRLSGRVPLVGVTSGRCFAGNAALLGCCDVIIATENSTIGMGGPAMIEGGGLGVFRPEEVGPASVHKKNGVIDVLVADEAAAVAAAKQYLSYFQGAVDEWECADQRLLRQSVPEDRLRVYDMREVIRLLADTDSVLELRQGFGLAMITALARVEGRPVGIIANNPAHLGGAIDSDAADKAARFMQLCEAFGIPLVMLSDTAGIMVGPDAEKTALVRHSARMFVVGANLTVPMFSVVLRKSYGLGAIAMTGGSYQASIFSVAWPTGEFGGMGLEGAVKLGYRKELAAIEDAVERKAKFDEMVAAAYERGKALSTATGFTIDNVIDPAETRRWIGTSLCALPPRHDQQKRLRWIDSW